MTKTLVTWEIRATTRKSGLKETTRLLYSKGNSKGRDLLQDGESSMVLPLTADSYLEHGKNFKIETKKGKQPYQ